MFMNEPKNYHKTPTITVRLDSQEEKNRLESYSDKHGVSMSWIIKKALRLFWEAVDKGKIKI